MEFYYKVKKNGAIMITCVENGVPTYPCTLNLDGLRLLPPENHVVIPINDIPKRVCDEFISRLVERETIQAMFGNKGGIVAKLKDNWREHCKQN